jgi:hypothetical protein
MDEDAGRLLDYRTEHKFTNHVAGVCVPKSASLSHSCEDVSEGGPPLFELVSSSTSSMEGDEEGELTSRFVISITICGLGKNTDR